MNKLITYIRYLYDYLKHGDIISVISSVRYVINRKSHKNDRIIRTSAGIFFCRKNTNDFQFANYYYERGVSKYFIKNKKEFTVFIDGGACNGNYSVLMAKAGLKCIAFEPVKTNYNVLCKNLELNNLQDKVKSFEIGLGDENKSANFIFNAVNTGASHITTEQSTMVTSVEIRTLDSLMNDLSITENENILFKLDVEGMEVEAIKGASNFIQKYPRITFVIEDKHSGKTPIKNALTEIAGFEFGIVDEFNIYAKKLT